jgi:hypothetical protein
MATPPDFTAGAVLTAAQMDAVGLWLVKSQTIGTGVASVVVDDAFSADYDNYRILVSGGAGSASAYLAFTLTGGSNVYDSNFLYSTYGGGGASAAGTSSGSSWPFSGSAQAGEGINMVLEIQQPFLEKYTMFSAPLDNFELAGHSAGRHRDATSFTGFTITPASGTLTGGTISVYGYRKA